MSDSTVHNLLVGSYDLSTVTWGDKATRSGERFHGAAVADLGAGPWGINFPPGSHRVDARATSGAEYVLSFWARADVDGDRVHSEAWGSVYVLDAKLTTEWQQVVIPYGIIRADQRSIFFWGLGTNSGTVHVALPMCVRGTTPAAWAPAEGETLAGGGALMSANLWDASTASHKPDSDGIYTSPGSGNAELGSYPSTSRLTENQTVHMAASLLGDGRGYLRPFVKYEDAAHHVNYVGFPNWTPSGTWQRFEGFVVVPSGMTVTKVGFNNAKATGDIEVSNPVFSYGDRGPVYAIASSTLAWSAGIVATTRYYQLAAPTAATPTAPASSSDLGSWSETEPAADVTKVLWTCECTHYTDGTESWSQASKSTSYEAAKDAKDAATAAQSTADTAKEAASANTTDLTNYIESNDSALSQMQSQIDGSITTWFYDVAPTADNAPAKDWTTTDLKNNHLGDLYYDTVTGYCYRYQVLNNAYSWSRITDTDVTKALSDAEAAQDTADSKRRIFVNTPTPPYDVGDQWAQGTSGDILICSTAKASGQSYAASDWTKASKYTDDTAAAAAQSTADDAKSAAADNASEIATIKTDYVTNSTFDQSNTEIKASVADTLTQAKTYTDDSVETEVTNRNAAITESASEIKSEVSETYATQDSLAAANSAITQNANAISSEVTARETTDSNVSTLSTKVTQNADSITTEISERKDAISDLQSASLSTVAVYYALGDSASTAPTSGWSTTAPTWVSGKYMWQKTTTTKADGTSTDSDPTCISGATGATGSAGKGISSTAITYQVGSSATTAPTGTWNSSVQSTTTDNPYLWTRTITTYSDGSTSTSYSVGAKGDTGDQGDTGVGVSSVTPYYYLSSSSTTQTGGSWSTTCPAWQTGYYYWTKNRVVYSDGSTADTAPVLDQASNTANQTANAANTTATTLSTLIRESSSGVDVGKSTDGSTYSTSIARVGSDGAFHILTSALVEVAKYAGTLIELGKNSTNSVIKFCADKASISYDDTYKMVDIDSPEEVRLKSALITDNSTYSMSNIELQKPIHDASTPTIIDSFGSAMLTVNDSIMNDTGTATINKVAFIGVDAAAGTGGASEAFISADNANIMGDTISFNTGNRYSLTNFNNILDGFSTVHRSAGTLTSYNNGTMHYTKIGTWSVTSDSDTLKLRVMTGNGFNGQANQNSEIDIFIKKSNATSGTTGAFGVTYELHNACSADLSAYVVATAYNSCDVWIKNSWGYESGWYIAEYNGGTWSDGGSRHQKGTPSGTAQNTACTDSTGTYVLYNGGAALNYDTAPGAGTTGRVTLSKSAANFTQLTIFFKTDQYSAKSSIEVPSPNGSNVSMFCCTTAVGAMVIKGCVASISGKSITPVSGGSGGATLWNGSSNVVDTSANSISIIRVTGRR